MPKKAKMYEDVMYGHINMSDFKPANPKELEKLLQSEPDERKKIRQEVTDRAQQMAAQAPTLPQFGQQPGAPQGPPKMFENL